MNSTECSKVLLGRFNQLMMSRGELIAKQGANDMLRVDEGSNFRAPGEDGSKIICSQRAQ